MQETVQGTRNYNVNRVLTAKDVNRIARNSGSDALKDASSWYRFLSYRSGEKFFGFIVDDTAFLFGSFAKKHFRLAEIAVEQKNQKKGYGALLLSAVVDAMKKEGPFRLCDCVSKKNLPSLKTHEKCGFRIVSEEGYDYLLEETDDHDFGLEYRYPEA